MKIVITGATGNVGTSLIQSMATDRRIDSIVGVARRKPDIHMAKTTWIAADVAEADLVALFEGADAVVHLAWLIQPSRRLDLLQRTNLDGSRRVFQAVAEAHVPILTYASSVGTYSPGPKDRPVAEDWPTSGVSTSTYSRHKSEVEAMLDEFEREHPDVSVSRLRPGLVFKREAGAEIRRLFAGPFLPNFLLRRYLVPVVPATSGLRFQAVHSLDVGRAFRLAAVSGARGAFNIAAPPVLDSKQIGAVLDAHQISMPASLIRRLADWTWRMHLQPTPAGWLDLATAVPIMDTTRATDVLGWEPKRTATEALEDLLAGLRSGSDFATPPLRHSAGGPFRLRELSSGVGGA